MFRSYFRVGCSQNTEARLKLRRPEHYTTGRYHASRGGTHAVVPLRPSAFFAAVDRNMALGSIPDFERNPQLALQADTYL